jgi:hypothetical protein
MTVDLKLIGSTDYRLTAVPWGVLIFLEPPALDRRANLPKRQSQDIVAGEKSLFRCWLPYTALLPRIFKVD